MDYEAAKEIREIMTEVIGLWFAVKYDHTLPDRATVNALWGRLVECEKHFMAQKSILRLGKAQAGLLRARDAYHTKDAALALKGAIHELDRLLLG